MTRRVRSLSFLRIFAVLTFLMPFVTTCGSGGGGGGSKPPPVAPADVSGDWSGSFTQDYHCSVSPPGSGTDAGTFDMHIDQNGSTVSGSFMIRSAAFPEASGTLTGTVTGDTVVATLQSGGLAFTFTMTLTGETLGGSFSGTLLVCQSTGTFSATRAA